jgi:hypothetical protein
MTRSSPGSLLRQRRPGSDPAALAPAGWAAAMRMIDQYIAAGISKFVIRKAQDRSLTTPPIRIPRSTGQPLTALCDRLEYAPQVRSIRSP